eukprot:gene27496-4805_t
MRESILWHEGIDYVSTEAAKSADGSTGKGQKEVPRDHQRVICATLASSSDGHARDGLRCRFGGAQEVPAQSDNQGLVSCCPPPVEAMGLVDSTKTTVHVLHGSDVVAEDSFDYGAPTEKDGLMRDSKDPSDVKGRAEDDDGAAVVAQVPSADLLLLHQSTRNRLQQLGGAIRMIVLLHAYNSGFTAWEVAIMFTAYELAGVFTNLLAGIAGAKWGIKTTLLCGLSLQIFGISLLYAWNDAWGHEGQLEKQTRLFKLVSFITGMKNSLAGVGYFLGAALVAVSYELALGVLLILIFLAMPWAIIALSNKLGRAKKENLTLSKIFKQSYNINVLSISRDEGGLGWSRPITGLFLALFIIIYGQIQSWTPWAVLSPLKQSPANKYVALLWNILLVFCPLFLALSFQLSPEIEAGSQSATAGFLISGIGMFCFVFAVNSSVHSYLVVRYADGDKAAVTVGFYYMANAMGRLVGTLASGALYSFTGSQVTFGLANCFWAAFAFALASAVVEFFVKDDVGGLICGCFPIIKPPPAKGDKKDSDVAIVMEA